MSKVTLKKYKEKNRICSFVITISEGKGNRKWTGDFYLTLDEAKELMSLLKKELKIK